MVVDLKQPSGSIAKVPGNPIKLDSFEEDYKPAPELGNNTDEVLSNYLELDAKQLEQLKKEKII